MVIYAYYYMPNITVSLGFEVINNHFRLLLENFQGFASLFRARGLGTHNYYIVEKKKKLLHCTFFF